jgi:hypothetical protein
MELDRLIERPGIRLFEDGVDELLPGLFLAGTAAAFIALTRLPHNWAWGYAGFSGPLLLAAFGFGLQLLRNKLRQTIVFPRGGFVALPQNSSKYRWFMVAFVVTGVLFRNVGIDRTAIALCLVYAGIWLYTGFRYGVRYYQAIGALALPAAVLASRANLRAPIIFITIGSVNAAIGAVKLWKFAHSHPILTESEA